MLESESCKTLFLEWCTHLLERIVRFRQYVSERAATIPTGDYTQGEIIDDLLKANDALALQLHVLASELAALDLHSIEQAKESYYSALAFDFPKQFRKNHWYLRLIPSPWPPPELGLFVTKILRTAGYPTNPSLQAPWAILLSGRFNFSDIVVPDLAEWEDMSASFSQAPGLHPQGNAASVRDVLEIPAIERENPLAWPNLIHELGHLVANSTVILREARSLPVVRNSRLGTMLRDLWLEEIVADLIATDLLGMAYYGSFATFAAYWTKNSVRYPEETHPSVESRRNYIASRLKHTANWDGRTLDLVNRLYDGRLRLDQANRDVRDPMHDQMHHLIPWAKSYEDLNSELENVAEAIVSLDEYKKAISMQKSTAPVDGRFIEILATRLASGELIAGSYNRSTAFSGSSSAEVQKRIADARTRLVEQPTEKTALAEMQKILVDAKGLLGEGSNNVKDIITAALVLKVSPRNQDAAEFLQEFCKPLKAPAHENIRRRLIRLWPRVHDFDMLVAKSIETTEVVQFYQLHRPEVDNDDID